MMSITSKLDELGAPGSLIDAQRIVLESQENFGIVYHGHPWASTIDHDYTEWYKWLLLEWRYMTETSQDNFVRPFYMIKSENFGMDIGFARKIFHHPYSQTHARHLIAAAHAGKYYNALIQKEKLIPKSMIDYFVDNIGTYPDTYRQSILSNFQKHWGEEDG